MALVRVEDFALGRFGGRLDGSRRDQGGSPGVPARSVLDEGDGLARESSLWDFPRCDPCLTRHLRDRMHATDAAPIPTRGHSRREELLRDLLGEWHVDPA
jgi:hypothetical protein